MPDDRCPSCGAFLTKKDKFCPICDERIKSIIDKHKHKPQPGKSQSIQKKVTSKMPSDQSDKKERIKSSSTSKQPYPYQHPPYHYPYYQYPPYQHPYYQPQYYPYQQPYYPPPYYDYYQTRSTSDAAHTLAALPVLPSYLFLGIILFINILMLLIGLGIVFPNIPMGVATIALIYPWPNFLYLIDLSGAILAAWYIFIVVAIVISVMWLIKTEGREFLKIISKSAKKIRPPPSKSDNSFVMIAQLFFALIFFNMVVIIFLMFLGVPDTPATSGEEPVLWEYFFDLANASVAEEIFTRTLYIGIPLLVFDSFAQRRKQKIYRYFIGGGFKLEHITILLIIISSILFGLAHYPSWGLWKVIPTFVAGLAFGYLFVKKGIHTAIILHFLFDYMSLALLFFSGYIVILMLFAAILGLILLFWTFSGFIYFFVYLSRIIEFFNERLFGPSPYPATEVSGTGVTARTVRSSDIGSEITRPYKKPEEYYAKQPSHPPPQYYPYWYPGYYYPPPSTPPEHTPTPPKPREGTTERINRCSSCKNKMIYVPYAGRYYCQHCSKYEY